MGMPQREKKRKDPRIPIHILVDFKMSDIVTMEHAQNISKHGIFIETRDVLPIGCSVLLSFILPEETRLITAMGEVVWARGKSYQKRASTTAGIGIRFTEINPEDETAIESFVEEWEDAEAQA